MIIASDIDGVIANIKPVIQERVADYFRVPAELVTPDKAAMQKMFGIDPADYTSFLQVGCFSDYDFWLSAPPIEENIEALNDLVWGGEHELVLITGRKNTAREATCHWLIRNRLSYNSLLMDALQLKHKAMKFCGAELMIEDRFEEAKTIAEQGYRSYLIRTGYNIQHETRRSGPIIWVDNINDVLDLEGIQNV